MSRKPPQRQSTAAMQQEAKELQQHAKVIDQLCRPWFYTDATKRQAIQGTDLIRQQTVPQLRQIADNIELNQQATEAAQREITGSKSKNPLTLEIQTKVTKDVSDDVLSTYSDLYTNKIEDKSVPDPKQNGAKDYAQLQLERNVLNKTIEALERQKRMLSGQHRRAKKPATKQEIQKTERQIDGKIGALKRASTTAYLAQNKIKSIDGARKLSIQQTLAKDIDLDAATDRLADATVHDLSLNTALSQHHIKTAKNTANTLRQQADYLAPAQRSGRTIATIEKSLKNSAEVINNFQDSMASVSLKTSQRADNCRQVSQALNSVIATLKADTTPIPHAIKSTIEEGKSKIADLSTSLKEYDKLVGQLSNPALTSAERKDLEKEADLKYDEVNKNAFELYETLNYNKEFLSGLERPTIEALQNFNNKESRKHLQWTQLIDDPALRSKLLHPGGSQGKPDPIEWAWNRYNYHNAKENGNIYIPRRDGYYKSDAFAAHTEGGISVGPNALRSCWFTNASEKAEKAIIRAKLHGIKTPPLTKETIPGPEKLPKNATQAQKDAHQAQLTMDKKIKGAKEIAKEVYGEPGWRRRLKTWPDGGIEFYFKDLKQGKEIATKLNEADKHLQEYKDKYLNGVSATTTTNKTPNKRVSWVNQQGKPGSQANPLTKTVNNAVPAGPTPRAITVSG